jgi:monoamine oxidase
MEGTSSFQEEQNSGPKYRREIIIVGGGFAGLACARQLLKPKNETTDNKIKVTIMEASNDIGGRVKGNHDFLPPGHVLDLGAEFIHCQGHVLWDWIDEFYGPLSINQAGDRNENTNSKFESIFLLSHADGGPAEEPTEEGKYGMYYMDNELMMYNDRRLDILNERLEAIAETEFDTQDSLADALRRQSPPLSDSLWQLAVSSYGNTAGCCDLTQLSISQLSLFEHYWESNEEEGDFRPPSTMGMYGIAQACLQSLKNHDNFEFIRNCEVQTIRQDDDAVVVQAKHETDRHADAVIVTVPPPILPNIIRNMPDSKREALNMIGFERAIKVIVKFRERLWPSDLQSIIAAGELIPEIWFREIADTSQGTINYLATGFLVSDAADRLVELLNDTRKDKNRNEQAGELLLQQLVKMLKSIPMSQNLTAQPSLITDAVIFDWKDDAIYAGGGYMYPKVGITPSHLNALAAPFGSIFFAGEATNTNACCTVQAAIETGQRAAAEVESFLNI